VLKIPEIEEQAQVECELYRATCGYFEGKGKAIYFKNLGLVPVEYLGFQGTVRRSIKSPYMEVGGGILMPPYPTTLFQVPFPIDASVLLSHLNRLRSAIDAVHEAGWLHGDVKPQNIFISVDGLVWLGDYGSSREYAQINTYGGGTVAFQCSDVPYYQDHRKFDLVGLALSILSKMMQDEAYASLYRFQGPKQSELVAKINLIDSSACKSKDEQLESETELANLREALLSLVS
jgi:serine/threonine protein kinase